MLESIVNLLPERFQPLAKAVIAGVIGSGLISLVTTGLVSGEWDRAAIVAAIVAVLTGAGVYTVPNLPTSRPEPVELPEDVI